MKNSKFKTFTKDFSITALTTAATVFVCFFLKKYYDSGEMSSTYTSILFILAVFLVSRYTNGYFFGIVSSLLSVIFINYYFTYPYFALNMSLPGYPIVIASTIIVAIITSAMTTKLKHQNTLKNIANEEKMRSNLLRAISHDLRTPLTTVLGAVSGIIENEDKLTMDDIKELLADVKNEVEWLIAIVENLLTITKINSDVKQIKKCSEIAEEIVTESVNKIKKRHTDAPVFVKIPSEVLFVPMDPLLIEQVIINIIENSIRHGQTVSKIDVSLEKSGSFAKFTICDNGIGFGDPKTVFKQSSSGITVKKGDTTKNMGIGLCVCKSIIDAHGGTINASNIITGGAKIEFYLPLEDETDQTIQHHIKDEKYE